MAAATPIRIAIDDLDIATLKSEINEGHSVDLVRGEDVIAEVRSRPVPSQEPVQRPPLPDFEARLREVWGDHVFPKGYMTAVVREDRDGRG